ncbi:MAG: hypothetical protein AAGH53_13465 [Pseudomonadota bacterium]
MFQETKEDSFPPLPRYINQNGVWLDERVNLRETEGSLLVAEIMQQLPLVKDRQRAMSEDNHHQMQCALKAILANGLRCRYFRDPAVIAYFRKSDGYAGNDGRPTWLSGKVLSRIVDDLEGLGFVKSYAGSRGRSSRFELTDTLAEMGKAYGITEDSITADIRNDELVRLRETNASSNYVDFKPTAETKAWSQALEAYNRFIVAQSLSVQLSSHLTEQWIDCLNLNKPRSSPGFTKPEMFQTALYRQFNNTDFRQGGRLYGGWWIQAPKSVREQILINGNPVVELDYSGCHISMLYHQRGLECPDDPYALSEVEEVARKAGGDPRIYRSCIKQYTQGLINGKKGGRPDRIELSQEATVPPGFKSTDLIALIERKHQPISDSFRSNAGLVLQREDSDIALEIISNLTNSGIPVLPIHDSFIVEAGRTGILKEEMERIYQRKFGFLPNIK